MDWKIVLESVQAVGVPVAILLLLFNYATRTLIPELQKERSEALHTFQEESRKERESHELTVRQVVEAGRERDKMWMEMMKELMVGARA